MSRKLTKDMLGLMRRSGYSEKAIDYFRNNVNMGQIENADKAMEYTGPCGDVLQIYLKLNNAVIEDAKFQCLGCPGVAACASAITEMAKGKTLKDAKKITEKDVLKELGGLPEPKLDCAKLAVTTLQRALAEYKALGPFEA